MPNDLLSPYTRILKSFAQNIASLLLCAQNEPSYIWRTCYDKTPGASDLFLISLSEICWISAEPGLYIVLLCSIYYPCNTKYICTYLCISSYHILNSITPMFCAVYLIVFPSMHISISPSGVVIHFSHI